MKILFLGNKQAGIIGLLTTLAFGCDVKGVVTVNEPMREVATSLGLPLYNSIKQREIPDILKRVDLMVSVHSREIIPKSMLDMSRLGGINVHPCLYAYKGADPVNRWLAGIEPLASVGVHKMTEEVDCGEVITEFFVQIDRNTVHIAEEVYNQLYPLYSLALLDALRRL